MSKHPSPKQDNLMSCYPVCVCGNRVNLTVLTGFKFEYMTAPNLQKHDDNV